MILNIILKKPAHDTVCLYITEAKTDETDCDHGQCACVVLDILPGGEEVQVKSVFVPPTKRRQGRGTRALRLSFEHLALNELLSNFKAVVEPSVGAATSFYREFGFQQLQAGPAQAPGPRKGGLRREGTPYG